MKTGQWAKMLTDLPPAKVFDQEAMSISELIAASGRSVYEMKKIATENVKRGVWEMVWKRSKSGAYRAYRKAKR